MNQTAENLRMVDASSLFEYPIQKGERLDTHHFMPWKFDWWLHSELRLRAEKDVRAVAFDLFCIAQKEDPVGTLPTDDLLLARLTGETLEEWQRLMKRPITPLHKWKQCQCSNGEIRLYHETVLKIAKEALGLRDDKLAKLEADRDRKRILALPDLMARAGAPRGMIENDIKIAQFDQFLIDNYSGKQRRVAFVRQALEEWQMENERGLYVPNKRP